MALDITDIRLNRRQEKEVMKAAREKGHINLILDEGKVRLSARDDGTDAGDDIAVIDFGNHYYEQLLARLAGKGIVPSRELTRAIEKAVTDEKVYEDGAFFKAVGKIDGETDRAVSRLRKEIERQLRGDLTPKQRNDYRAVLRKLDGKDYKPDYVEKWTGRVLGAEKLESYDDRLQSARDEFGDAALLHRLYSRIFIRGKDIRGGERLRWVRLVRPE
jgi:hypothetical protein